MPPTLLSVPNVSEGRDAPTLDAIGAAFETGATLLDRHEDPDHHRAVFSLAGEQATLPEALLAGACEAVARIDLREERGQHPHVGAIDVVPLVYPAPDRRGAACAAALVTAETLATELRLPVFLYGELADGRTRAELRRGPKSGASSPSRIRVVRFAMPPRRPHPSAGVTLVSARPPLVAFNVELASPGHFGTAREVAAAIREGGREGLPGLRAIGIELHTREGTAQVSMNVEDPYTLPLAAVVEAIVRHADVSAAEIVGLAPRAALAGFPPELEIRGFDPQRQIIENRIDV